MDIKMLIEQLSARGLSNGSSLGYHSGLFDDAATALSTLQAENERLQMLSKLGDMRAQDYRIMRDRAVKAENENEKLRAELEQVKQLYETEKEDFGDYACSGVPNLSPYCMNRRPDCVDERGWCRSEKCHGFSRERGQKED